MKKYILFIPFIALYIVALVYFFFFYMEPVKLDFADSVTLIYEYKQKIIHTSITNPGDLAALREACAGNAISSFSAPASEFGNCVLIFKKDDREVALYPSCDNYSYLKLGDTNKYINASQEKREQMLDVLRKYGAEFPCSNYS